MNNNFLRALLGIIILFAITFVVVVVIKQKDVIFNHTEWQTITVIDRHQPLGDEGDVVISEETETYTIEAKYSRDLPEEVRLAAENLIAEFKTFEYLDTGSGVPYNLILDVVTHAHPQYKSYIIDSYAYTGGANGNASQETFVYENGNLVSLDNVLTNVLKRADISQAVTAQLDEEYTDIWFGEGVDSGSAELENFFFTKDSLRFAFSEYAVGPGVLGAITIEIPLSELVGVLSSETDNASVTDFWSCVEITGIVMESYPRQCAHDGKTYVEVIDDVEPIGDKTGCVVAGCSSQLCISAEEFEKTGGVSTCEYREEYMCYQQATCAYQATGECGWTQDDELTQCLSGV